MNEMACCCLLLGLGGCRAWALVSCRPLRHQHACTAHGRGLPCPVFPDAPARRTLAHVCAGGKPAAATPASQHRRLPRGRNHGQQGHVAHGESCSLNHPTPPTPAHTTQCTATATTHPHPTPPPTHPRTPPPTTTTRAACIAWPFCLCLAPPAHLSTSPTWPCLASGPNATNRK